MSAQTVAEEALAHALPTYPLAQFFFQLLQKVELFVQLNVRICVHIRCVSFKHGRIGEHSFESCHVVMYGLKTFWMRNPAATRDRATL